MSETMPSIRLGLFSWIAADQIRAFGFDEATGSRWYKYRRGNNAIVVPERVQDEFDDGIRACFGVDLAACALSFR